MDYRGYLVRQVVCHANRPRDGLFTVVTEPKAPHKRDRVRRPLLTAAEILASLEDRGLSSTEARRLVREAQAAMTRGGWPASSGE